MNACQAYSSLPVVAVAWTPLCHSLLSIITTPQQSVQFVFGKIRALMNAVAAAFACQTPTSISRTTTKQTLLASTCSMMLQPGNAANQ